MIRAARDDDAEALIALIAAVFDEYPGCILDVDDEAPELRAIATASARRGGGFWVAEEGARVVGSVGLSPVPETDGIELLKLYVAREARRKGLGERLVRLVEQEARRRGAPFVELWTDTRFRDAHRLYERLGFRGGEETRELHDLSASVEYYYRLELRGV
jgi:putative acetyltransferase